MKRKFECLNCHQKFEGDDQMDQNCPKCGSDNVRPVGTNSMGIILKVAVFLVALIIGFFVVKFVKGTGLAESEEDMSVVTVNTTENDEDGVMQPPVSASEDTLVGDLPPVISAQEKKIEAEATKVPVKQPVTLAIKSYPKIGADGKYTFSATAEHLPSGVTVTMYKLVNAKGDIVASSPSGSFQGVPASADKGRYNLLAELSNGDIVTKEGVSGFVTVEVVDNRMQAEELTILLNKLDSQLGKGKNPKVVAKPIIIINNSLDENDRSVKLIDDIMGRIELGSWSSVTVTQVEYDAKGRINKFAITINK